MYSGEAIEVRLARLERQLKVSDDRGDASVTLSAISDVGTQQFLTALTQNRTVTLTTAGAVEGDYFIISRSGLGAFTLDVGGLKTLPSATAAWCEVAFKAGAWKLVAYGTL